MPSFHLASQVKSLPRKPGVYTFRNGRGELLYVGKGKNLKNRVRSYFRIKGDRIDPSPELTPAKQIMVSQIRAIETTIVSNETEALLWEAELIKRNHPPYNIVLADDKSYVYIKFDFDRAYPDVYPVRRPAIQRKSRSLLFGPYTSAASAYTVLKLAKKIFPYCLKPPTVRNPRHPRGCLYWYLGRCPGPCMAAISPQQYEKILRQMVPLFQGKFTGLLKMLSADMRAAVEKREFETAVLLRDQINALKIVTEKQKVVDTKKESYDIASIAANLHLSVISLFRIRDGILIDRISFPLRHPTASKPVELIESFLPQYYAYTADVPHFIYSPFHILSPLPGKLKTAIPRRGKKRTLMLLGKENAEEELVRFITLNNMKKSKTHEALSSLMKLFKLRSLPERIEAYDISHIQGHHAVGAMTVLLHGVPAPREYRRFTITLIKGSNDVAMLQEVLRRRLRHSMGGMDQRELNADSRRDTATHKLTNPQTEPWPLPDLILIDGGKPQRSAAQKVLMEFNSTVPLIAIAKGRGLAPHLRRQRGEEIWIAPSPKTQIIKNKKINNAPPPEKLTTDKLMIDHSPALLLLDRVRDEAHRFGIMHYRDRHRRNLTATRLDDVPGIGPHMRTLLLQSFGSLEGVLRASRAELEKCIGKTRTEKLLNYHILTHIA